MIKIACEFCGNADLSQFLDCVDNTYNGCKFVGMDCFDVDYVVILDSLSKAFTLNVNPAKTFFLTAETLFPKGYYADKTSFLKQFGKIYSCHDIFMENVIYDLPFQCWMLYSGYHFDILSNDIKYSDIKNLNPEKTKTLSVFCSSKASNENYALRLRFVTELKKHFKDKLDWFGGGINPINPKAGGILPYKYHLALENHSDYNIITEKLYDSYLGLSYPIYYGAPNVGDYFSHVSFSQINITDLKGSIRTIEQVMEDDLYEKHLSDIKKARDLVLGKYNMFKRIADIVNNDVINGNDYLQSKQNITLFPMDSRHVMYKKKNLINFTGKVIKKIGQKIIDFS